MQRKFLLMLLISFSHQHLFAQQEGWTRNNLFKSSTFIKFIAIRPVFQFGGVKVSSFEPLSLQTFNRLPLNSFSQSQPFFCSMENSLHRHLNIWIKIRAGDDDGYRKLTDQTLLSN